MCARTRELTPRGKQQLTSGWEFCATAPGEFSSAPDILTSALPWTATCVPSTAASSLRACGAWSLDGPARRFDAEDWWYRLRFDAPDTGQARETILGFDGLATVAEVWLNDEHLLHSENMFRAHECRVDNLRTVDNELVICFRALDALLTAKRPRPRWRAPIVENQQLRWFRTTLLGRTPGWSPPAAAVGPWRGIWLQHRDPADLVDIRLQSRLDNGVGVITVACRSAGDCSSTQSVELAVNRHGHSYRVTLREKSAGCLEGRLQISNPDLWWPHTHGDPALYRAQLIVTRESNTSSAIDLGAVGLRTMELDTTAGNFALLVNGVRIFCRGACWTPLDPVTLHANAAAYQQALQLVQSAGMNMLRVGGTMCYEADEFYAQCDALGILVWQDFMFANMDYPEGDADFHASVCAEAEQILMRLRAHPCLAVLCGNSEVEQQAAMWGAPRERWSPALFHTLLADKSRELCPDVPYWPSSAHGGAFPHDARAGTTSYYGVGAYLRPLHDARRAELRFATECLAFANVPDAATLDKMPGGASIRVHDPLWKARSPRDLGAGWDFDDVRDHYLRELFTVAPTQLRSAEHDRYLALSRATSGEVMAEVFGEWRRQRSTCNGALIWFLRDLWPGAGWGLVGSDGVPKAPYYYLRRALQPVAVFISDEGGNGLALHVVNDRSHAVDGTLELVLYRGGEVVVARGQAAVHIPARETLELAAGDLLEGFYDLSYAYRFGPSACDLIVASLRIDGAAPVEAFYFPLGRSSHLGKVTGLVAHAAATAAGEYSLTLRTGVFAQTVVVETDGYVCDDQYFHLSPGSERNLQLRPADRTRSQALRGRVRALNLKTAVPIEIQA
jgi:beta-mannosidase